MARKEQQLKNKNIALRKNRTRKSIVAKSALPRLSINRSLKHLYMQIIDDSKGITICSASDKDIQETKGKKGVTIAAEIGKIIAKKALEKKVKKVVFDRGAYKYHGRVQAAADSAREGGLEF